MKISNRHSDKKSTKTGEMIKQNKDTGIIRNGKKTAGKLTIQLEKINQKVQAKEGRLTIY